MSDIMFIENSVFSIFLALKDGHILGEFIHCIISL